MKSLVAPFRIVGGRIAETSDPARVVEQKIINVLTINKLERVGLPEYGAGVLSLLFEVIDELVETDFKVDAAAELAENITALNLIDIRVRPTGESQADVSVYYQLPMSPVNETTFSIATGLTEESSL